MNPAIFEAPSLLSSAVGHPRKQGKMPEAGPAFKLEMAEEDPKKPKPVASEATDVAAAIVALPLPTPVSELAIPPLAPNLQPVPAPIVQLSAVQAEGAEPVVLEAAEILPPPPARPMVASSGFGGVSLPARVSLPKALAVSANPIIAGPAPEIMAAPYQAPAAVPVAAAVPRTAKPADAPILELSAAAPALVPPKPAKASGGDTPPKDSAPFRMESGGGAETSPATEAAPVFELKAAPVLGPKEPVGPAPDVRVGIGPDSRLDVTIRTDNAAMRDQLEAASGDLELELAAIGAEVEAITVELRPDREPDAGADGFQPEAPAELARADLQVRTRAEAADAQGFGREAGQMGSEASRREAGGRGAQDNHQGHSPERKTGNNAAERAATEATRRAALDAQSLRIDRYA